MQVLKYLFRLLVPYRTTLAVSVVLLLARAAVELLPPLFQRRIIDDVNFASANSSLETTSRFDSRLVRHYNDHVLVDVCRPGGRMR